jgi:hypothetical protein
MSSSLKGRRGGHPSTTTPIPPPWLSPQEEILKRLPNEFPIGTNQFIDGEKAKLKEHAFDRSDKMIEKRLI